MSAQRGAERGRARLEARTPYAKGYATGAEDGLAYAVGFLLGSATAFGDTGHGSLGHAFKAAADELARVEVDHVHAQAKAAE